MGKAAKTGKKLPSAPLADKKKKTKKRLEDVKETNKTNIFTLLQLLYNIETLSMPFKPFKGALRSRNPLFEKASRNYRLGGDIQPKRDLTRFVKWPKYVRLQRQKRIMLMRLKAHRSLHVYS